MFGHLSLLTGLWLSVHICSNIFADETSVCPVVILDVFLFDCVRKSVHCVDSHTITALYSWWIVEEKIRRVQKEEQGIKYDTKTFITTLYIWKYQ